MEYSLSLQSGKKPYEDGDRASDPLFNYVKEDVFNRPTFSTFLRLLVSNRYTRMNDCPSFVFDRIGTFLIHTCSVEGCDVHAVSAPAGYQSAVESVGLGNQ